MCIHDWQLNPPADPDLVAMALSMPRLKPDPALAWLYAQMNGCRIMWTYDHDGIRHEGHLQIWPVEEMVDRNFVEDFGYDNDDVPGVSRLAKSAYILSQNDSDTCIDFRSDPPTILLFAQRGDIKPINLPIAHWLDITLLTVGHKGFWFAYNWAQKAGRHKVQNLGIRGWDILYPEVAEALGMTR